MQAGIAVRIQTYNTGLSVLARQVPLGEVFAKNRSGKEISDDTRQQGEKREVEGSSQWGNIFSLGERPMLTMSSNLFHTELDCSRSKILLLCWITETGSRLRPQFSLMKSVIFFSHS